MNSSTATHNVSTRAGLIAFYDEAFDAVYRCAAQLTRGNRAAAEDLVQEGFLRLTRVAKEGKIQEVGTGWMITTIRRIHIDKLRSLDREQRRVRLVTDTERDKDQWSAANQGEYLLRGLNEREQTALILRYVEDLSVGEIATLMDVSPTAAQSLLQRAKSKARAQGVPQ